MNIVRKLNPRSVDQPAHSSSPSADSSQSGSNDEIKLSSKQMADRALLLVQLRKAYAEYAKVPMQSTMEHEDKIRAVLPLFAQVIESYEPADLQANFKELPSFTGHVARYFVQEIRKRAANQSTEQAAHAIAIFVCPSDAELENLSNAWSTSQQSTSRRNPGWLLLYGLCILLRSKHLASVEAACRAALPSTMAKALYLFYDLPEQHSDQQSVTTEKWQNTFVEVLSRLCSHSCAGEELARKDDLSLLFSGASSWCPPSNVRWRKATSELLMIISTRILTQTLIKYIHSKNCLSQFVENLAHADEGGAMATSEMVDMIVCLFCILKDSSNVTPVLLNDFKAANGYDYLTKFILNHSTDCSPDDQEAIRNLLLMFSTAVTAGTNELKPSLSSSLYTLPGFTLPSPLGHGCSVRNVHAFHVLEEVFLKVNFLTSAHPECENAEISATVLDVIQSIYTADAANYFVLEQECTLGRFAEIIHTKHKTVQSKFFDLLEYVVFHLNHVPCKEFIALCVMVKTQTCVDCYTLCVQSCFRILTFNPLFRDVFREVGLLETLTWLLTQYANRARQKGLNSLMLAEQQLSLLVIDILAMIIKGNSANARVLRECLNDKPKLSITSSTNQSNVADVYRECEGGSMLIDLITHQSTLAWRSGVLRLVQQLLMLAGGDEYLASLTTLLQTLPYDSFTLKMDILKALLCVLRESHRVRVSFRRTGGYLGLMSVLLSLDGAFSQPPHGQWAGNELLVSDATDFARQAIDLLLVIFKVLTISMRFEPSNAKFFQSEIRYNSLTVSLRLTGAFTDRCESDALEIDAPSVSSSPSPDSDGSAGMDPQLKSQLQKCQDMFHAKLDNLQFPDGMPLRAVYMICMFRFLYNLALDNYDKPPDQHQPTLVSDHSLEDTQKCLLFPPRSDQIVVHPRALICILDLLPSAVLDDKSWCTTIQLYACEIIKSILRTERNQQVMCDSCLPRRLFVVGRNLLRVQRHILLEPFMYVLDRISAQAMQPKELRDLLRLDLPLCCRSLDECSPYRNVDLMDVIDNEPVLATEGGPVPLYRVKALVSMMTPRDSRNVRPPFIEFDMSVEGFGCVFLPSISPSHGALISNQGLAGGIVNTASSMALLAHTSMHGSTAIPLEAGGVGQGERVFPPVAGITYSTWFYVERFSGRMDAHPIRLLTVTRCFQGSSSNEKMNRRSSTLTDWWSVAGDLSSGRAGQPPQLMSQNSTVEGRIDHPNEFACVSIQVSPRDRCLIVSTYETDSPGADLEMDSAPPDCCVRIRCPELSQERQWMHLTVVLSRAVLKHSMITVYMDGIQIAQQRLQYIQANVPSSASNTGPVSVHTIVGTPPGPLRKQSSLLWRMAATHLIEEPLTPEQVESVYHLGPSYTGSYQSPDMISTPNNGGLIIPEDKICFGLHAQAQSQMTISRLRKVYNKTDSKAIAKYLGISTHENATPIRILHNSAGHLQGPARSLGGVLIGYLGIRTFCPHAVPKLLESVGGTSALLGLVAMANDSEGLYASLKALLCAVRNNANIEMHMDQYRAYQTLGYHLKQKSCLLNSHILHLVFALIGTLDSTRETTIIPNVVAFEDLLVDLLIWRDAPIDVQRLLYEHFYELITESRNGRNRVILMNRRCEHNENLRVIRQTPLLTRLLFRAGSDRQHLDGVKDVLFNLFAAILQPLPDNAGLLRFGQFISSTLSVDGAMGAEKTLPLTFAEMEAELFAETSTSKNGNNGKLEERLNLMHAVYIRNRCLNIIANSLTHISAPLAAAYCSQLVDVLGFDWVLCMLAPRSHDGTVQLALRILVILLAQPNLLQAFKEGNLAGGGPLLDINRELCHCAGFTVLQNDMGAHAHSPDAYLPLLAVLVGRAGAASHRGFALPEGAPANSFGLDSIWSLVFTLSPQCSVADAIANATICVEATQPLLTMVRRCVHQPVSPEEYNEQHWTRTYPHTIVQFITFLYHNVTEFAMYCTTDAFLTSLVAVLFPPNSLEHVDDESTDAVVVVSPTRSEQQFDLATHTITNHPCCKSIVDLLKNILVDSFHSSPPSKNESPIDTILDQSLPDYVSRRQHSAFVTNLFNVVMEHLLASDVLIFGQSASLPLTAAVTGTSYNTLAANVFYFTCRLVDAVWNGLYTDNSLVVFEFVLKLLQQAKRKSGSGVPVDSLMHSLNRVVLHLLSRPVDGTQAQMSIVDSLHKVTANRSVIFSTANVDADFFCCLCHLLFMLSVKPEFGLSPDEPTTERNMVEQTSRFNEGSALVAGAACRVWEELYMNKKQVLEDRFKTALVPEVNAARALAGEAASRCWQAFVDGEIRGPSRDLSQIHLQLQSKIQKVATGLQRLTSRTAPSKPHSNSVSGTSSTGTSGNAGITSSSTKSTITKQDQQTWTRVHVCLIRELVRLQSTRYEHWHEHVHKYCSDEWHEVEHELTRERGLWGPDWGSVLDKFRLDSTEGPSRMRIKLVPNHQFFIDYPYRPELDKPENKALRNKVAISRDSQSYYERMKQRRPRTLDRRIIDQSAAVQTNTEQQKMLMFTDMGEVNTSMIRRVSINNKNASDSETDTDKPAAESAEIEELVLDEQVPEPGDDTASITSGGTGVNEPVMGNHNEDSITTPPNSSPSRGPRDVPRNETSSKPEPLINPLKDQSKTRGPDNQTLLRLLEQGEELQSMFRTARINGLESTEALLLFGKEHYYVVDGYTLLKTREIRDLDFLSEELHDPIVPYTAMGTTRPAGVKRLCQKFTYEDIREVHKRRYLLQPIALELFSGDGRNHLLAFPRRMRNRVHAKFISVAKWMADGGQSVSGQRSGVSIEQSSRISVISNLIGDTSVTQRWLRSEISNFQYLMALNTLAGRSYNDLSQYPVFPWILADYESDDLDLTNPSSFRDLSKPMGALDDNRLEQFMKRFREWDDPTGETPPYMFGTHYSSAMIVVSYLVRQEPFTQQFLKLQGGHFDLADRMFHSIRDSWVSASRNNMADVKELIPEFFYLPDILQNTNAFDLGIKQSGVALNDVNLPPWAKGSAREFIRRHREALECDFVSAHLHEWIDLIFGYKQKGEEAIKAHNLFHHLFYEGNVDFDLIEDPLTRNATIGFINNFGQIPSQLFKKPHPQKRLHAGAHLSRSTTISTSGSGALPLAAPDSAHLSTPGVTTDRLFYHALDSLKPPTQPVKQLRGAVGELRFNEKGGLVAVEQNKVMQPSAYQRYIAWGYADRSIRYGIMESEKSMCIHELSEYGEIVCAVCPNTRILITANTNTVVNVWELIGGSGRHLVGCRLRLRKSLYGHTESVSCLAASGAFGVVVSGSRDATCILWDLSTLSFIRQLGHHLGPVSAIAVNDATGDIASACGAHLYVWTLNGQLLSSINTCPSPMQHHQQIILSLAFSTLNEWDASNVVCTGTNDGVLKLFSLEFVQVKETTGVDATVMNAMCDDASLDEPTSPPQSAGPLTTEQLHQRLASAARTKSLKSGSSTLSVDVDATINNKHTQSFSASPETHSPGVRRHDSTQSLPHDTDDSFVFVNAHETDSAKLVSDFRNRSRSSLRPGHVWQQQLIFRSKLTMHTAFERKDNMMPAAITAIAPSKDHKSLYIGDGRGRVWQWVVGEGQPTGRLDHWVQDPARNTCTQCQQKFTLAERKHHCRNCGHIFCAKCSRFESEIRHMKISKPVRVCQSCFLRLKAQNA